MTLTGWRPLTALVFQVYDSELLALLLFLPALVLYCQTNSSPFFSVSLLLLKHCFLYRKAFTFSLASYILYSKS